MADAKKASIPRGILPVLMVSSSLRFRGRAARRYFRRRGAFALLRAAFRFAGAFFALFAGAFRALRLAGFAFFFALFLALFLALFFFPPRARLAAGLVL